MKLKYKIIITISIIISLLFPIFGYWKCPWKNNLGIECAGCGGTRMLLSTLNLDFYQAFRYNPLLFTLLIIGLIYLIYVIIFKIIKKNYYIPSYKWLYVLLVIVIVFMILRNISYFEYLKPTDV